MSNNKIDIIVVRHGEYNSRTASVEHSLTNVGRNNIVRLGRKLRERGYIHPFFVASPTPQTNASARVLAQALCGHGMTTVKTSLKLRSREEDWQKDIDGALALVLTCIEEQVTADSIVVVTHNEFAAELPLRLAKRLFGTTPPAIHVKCGYGAIVNNKGEIETISP